MASKTSTPLLILLGVLVIVALIAGGVWYLGESQQKAEVDRLLDEAQESHQLLKDSSAAKVALNKALKLDPDRWDAYYQLGLVTLALKQINEAIDSFEEASAKAPEDHQGPIALQLAQAYRRRYESNGSSRDFRLARSSFQRATDDAASRPQAMHGLGMLWLWAGKKSNNRENMIKSLEYLEPLLEKYPDYPDHEKLKTVVDMLTKVRDAS